MSGDHDTPIMTPKQLITVIVLSFVIPIALIVLLVSFVTGGKKVDVQGMALKPEAIAERIKPVAGINLKAADGPKVFLSGLEVYTQNCKACHEAGAANAPKMGDTAAWAPRLKQGYDTLVNHSVNGIRAMPARGGNGDLSDYEVARAVVYMTASAGGTFKEPAAPAAAAAPASAPAAPTAAAPAAPPPAAMVVASAAPAAAPAAAKASDGKALYESACVACHAAGVANAWASTARSTWSH
jgi:cytochrome c5